MKEGECPYPPGPYALGRVYVYPAKLDGLGLSLPEALTCGLPAVVPDAPPWNEFVTEGVNGWLVPIARRRAREDGIAFPETIVSVEGLVAVLRRVLEAPAFDLSYMANQAWITAQRKFSWDSFRAGVHEAFGVNEQTLLIDETTGAVSEAPLPGL